ncbi:YadA-like family protein, partial [uncultured Megasphaera sp.]|uniref:YadA-like family protein n=1 Tax=uncultured Megasphaera sp. TaxID=165188 RepID=UPI0025979068
VDGNNLITRQITGVAAGTKDTDAVNVAQLKVLNTKVDKGSIHYFSVKSTDKGIGSNWDNDGATGEDAVAIGYKAQAQWQYSTALGREAQALSNYSTALGYKAIVAGDSSTALGYNAQAQGQYSTAVGDDTQAIGNISVALGSEAKAQGRTSTALGHGAQAIGESSTALGHEAKAERDYSTALGWQAQAQGQSSTALGYLSQAQGASSTALGQNAQARLDGSIALGSFSIASIDKGVVGYDPFTGKASTENSAIWKATQAALSVGSTVDGNNLITRQITGVAAGTKDTDAVNVAQLKALEKKLIKVLPEVVGDQKTGVVVEKNPKENTSTPSTSETETPTGGVTTSLTSRTTPPTGVTTPPTGVTTPPTSETTPPTGVTTTAPAAENKTVYKVKLDKKIDVGHISIDGNENKETITIGKGDNHVIVNNTGLTIANGPSVTKSGINANKNKITNVGDGTISGDSTEAVNGKQLYGVEQDVKRNTTNIDNLQNNMYDMGMKVGELDTRVNKVGAGAAALAALHPQEFEPEDKWGIAAGVGNYKNATAAAVGLFYRPNERTLLNLGWTMGDSRNMVNAGVSVKLGSGSTYAGFSKVQMANRLTQQEEKITAQEQEIKELREREEQREKQMQEILSKLKMMEKTKA